MPLRRQVHPRWRCYGAIQVPGWSFAHHEPSYMHKQRSCALRVLTTRVVGITEVRLHVTAASLTTILSTLGLQLDHDRKGRGPERPSTGCFLAGHCTSTQSP